MLKSVFQRHKSDQRIAIIDDLPPVGEALANSGQNYKAVYVQNIVPDVIRDFFLSTDPDHLSPIVTSPRQKKPMRITIDNGKASLEGDDTEILPQDVVRFITSIGHQMAIAAGTNTTQFVIAKSINLIIHSGSWHIDDPRFHHGRELRGFIGVSSFDPERELDFIVTDNVDESDLVKITDSEEVMFGFDEESLPYDTVNSGGFLSFWSREKGQGSLKTDCLVHRTPPQKQYIPEGERRYSLLFQARQQLAL